MPAPFRFGSFTVDREAYRLLSGGTPVELPPKAFDLLVLFCDRPGTLVTKDEMLAALWPGLAVTDNAITQVVSDLRHALADQPSAPRYVETVARRGYRFVAQVQSDGPAPAPEAAIATAPAASVSSDTRARTIAVTNFANVSDDDVVAWLSAGIAETLTNDLRVLRDLRVLDRAGAAPSEGGAPKLQAARAAGIDLVVTGSFQRAGDRLRLMARVVDTGTREAIASAKADGTLDDVFAVQDAIVREIVAGLRVTVTPVAARRLSARETSSLDAYRALTEGRLKLETLDLGAVPGAIADFERAIALDPEYAYAHVGLAHAQFWRFQATRSQARPDRQALAEAIAHARRAVDIDPDLAEGHAALAFMLTGADRHREAIAAGRVAVALEPANWRHQFRLGMAEWGGERLICLEAALAQFPALAYAHFGIAMVHVARRDLEAAGAALERGAMAQDTAPSLRFPGRGIHWLAGLTRLATGDIAGATGSFDRELASPEGGMLAGEYAVDALDGLGFARLAAGDAAGARTFFERALERHPGHVRSLIALADIDGRQRHRDHAKKRLTEARQVIDDIRANGREGEATMALACWHAASNEPARAIELLSALLNDSPAGSAGWSIPVEPGLAALRNKAEFGPILAKLKQRAQ